MKFHIWAQRVRLSTLDTVNTFNSLNALYKAALKINL